MNSEELIDFGMERLTPSIIMVAGVGGAGSNAVNHMYELGIANVSFMICNTDKQSLRLSPVPVKVKLGDKLTEGLGAGNVPERGREAAIEALDEIVSIFKREGTKMLFVTAGMGGGTGTGAAPVIAKAASEMGILTVGIVTLPFRAEGKVRTMNAMEGLEELRKNVDALLVVHSESIQVIYGKLPISEAFSKADDILAQAAKGIAEIITRESKFNVDFADVRTVMTKSGIALMGAARASGTDRARKVAEAAISSPLLNHYDISGAEKVLLNITYGRNEITMDEMKVEIIEYIQDRARKNKDIDDQDDLANIIWGASHNPMLEDDEIEVTVVATGFQMDESSLWGDQAFVKPQPVNRGFTAPEPEDNSYTPKDEPAPYVAPEPFVPKPRTRWEPPTDKPNPFERESARNITTGNSAGVVNPFVPKQQEDRVIEVQSNDLYSNLKDIMSKPSYIRRNSKITTEATSPTGKTSRTVIKNEPAAESKSETKEGSLFD